MATARNVLEANLQISHRASGSICEVVFADFSQTCPAKLTVK